MKLRLLAPRERSSVLECLARDPRPNLQLMDMAAGVGEMHPLGEGSPQVLVAWEGGKVVGVAGLRPSLVLDSRFDSRIIDLLVPHVASIESGLIKSPESVVTPFWERLASQGREALIDRSETGYLVTAGDLADVKPPARARLRPAQRSDLDALVYAASSSLRAEGRPDPSESDPAGFRRWVRGRLRRARVIECKGSVVFVGYADVRRSEGWLIQGVFTWPEVRRRGLAAAGMYGLALEAFDQGAEHVQLAVVDGNEAALGLYRGLGFRPFAELRTILFT
ncbi:MAG: GNAT family N-acetyltransferase [Deltaproteobacteria bacterium]|nr:GNAT family N-acetyltransferase [Deltaproteobacteria bacterium]